MSEQQIPGVPKGCRLRGFFSESVLSDSDLVLTQEGCVARLDEQVLPEGRDPDKIWPVLEQPKQFEAVIAVAVGPRGIDYRWNDASRRLTMSGLLECGLTAEYADDLRKAYPASVTIREKEAKS